MNFKEEIKSDAMDIGEKMKNLGHSIANMGGTMLEEAGDKIEEMKDGMMEKMHIAKDEMKSMVGMEDDHRTNMK